MPFLHVFFSIFLNEQTDLSKNETKFWFEIRILYMKFLLYYAKREYIELDSFQFFFFFFSFHKKYTSILLYPHTNFVVSLKCSLYILFLHTILAFLIYVVFSFTAAIYNYQWWNEAQLCTCCPGLFDTQRDHNSWLRFVNSFRYSIVLIQKHFFAYRSQEE